MKVKFWGTRGSIPTPQNAGLVRAKIARALEAALERGLSSREEIAEFVDSALPFAVAGAFGGNTACVQVGAGEDVLLLDAGSGLREFGNDLLSRGQAQGREFHIFISHLHWDHLQGFPFFTPAYLPGNRVRIYGCHQELAQAFAAQQAPPFFPVPLKAMGAEISFTVLEPGRDYAIAGFAVQAIPQNHPQQSFGYSLSRQGRKIVYSTDAEHGETVGPEAQPFVEFFRGADLLIIDTQYMFAEAVVSKVHWGHASNLIAVDLAAEAGVRHLCMFHHEPTSSDEALQEHLDNTRTLASLMPGGFPERVSMAWDGLEIEV